MWPGVVTPDLQRAPTSKVNSIGVKWEEPVTTGGAIVSKLKVKLPNQRKLNVKGLF